MQLFSDIPTRHGDSPLTAPDSHIAVSSCSDKPWLSWDPFDLQDTQTFLDLVSSQNLQWDNQRVCHKIIVNSGVEHLDRPIVR